MMFCSFEYFQFKITEMSGSPHFMSSLLTGNLFFTSWWPSVFFFLQHNTSLSHFLQKHRLLLLLLLLQTFVSIMWPRKCSLRSWRMFTLSESSAVPPPTCFNQPPADLPKSPPLLLGRDSLEFLLLLNVPQRATQKHSLQPVFIINEILTQNKDLMQT